MELRKSYLIQRLVHPFGSELKEPAKAWKLEKDGSVSDESMKMRQDVHGYDYMGSSEFEFGAIPEAIKPLMRDAKKLIAFSIDTKVAWRRYRMGSDEPTVRTRTLFILCREEQAKEVEERIKWLVSDPELNYKLKESMYLDQGFEKDKKEDKHTRYVGWLELNNGFYFFSNKTAWQYMTKLYTGKIPA